MNDRLDDALVLRLVVTGESDLVVTLLHPQRGRIDALAKSARKSLRRFGALEPLARVSVQFGRGRGRLPLLTEATLSRAWPGRAYRQLTLASYAAELALHAAQPEHADPALHAWLLERLDSACSSQAEVVHWWLDTDIGFLQVVGGWPELAHCHQCGTRLESEAAWPEALQGWYCLPCAGGATEGLATRAGGLRPEVVRALRERRLEVLLPHEVRRVREMVGRLLGQVIHAPLRSVALMQALGHGV
jgi:DNA repair protein RecO (recombination protein O)